MESPQAAIGMTNNTTTSASRILNDEETAILTLFYSVTGIVGIPCTIMVFVVMASVSTKSFADFYIVLLAVNDFAVCLFAMPIKILEVCGVFPDDSISMDIAGRIMAVLLNTSNLLTPTLLMFLAVDRLQMVYEKAPCCFRSPSSPTLYVIALGIAVLLSLPVLAVSTGPASPEGGDDMWTTQTAMIYRYGLVVGFAAFILAVTIIYTKAHLFLHSRVTQLKCRKGMQTISPPNETVKEQPKYPASGIAAFLNISEECKKPEIHAESSSGMAGTGNLKPVGIANTQSTHHLKMNSFETDETLTPTSPSRRNLPNSNEMSNDIYCRLTLSGGHASQSIVTAQEDAATRGPCTEQACKSASTPMTETAITAVEALQPIRFNLPYYKKLHRTTFTVRALTGFFIAAWLPCIVVYVVYGIHPSPLSPFVDKLLHDIHYAYNGFNALIFLLGDYRFRGRAVLLIRQRLNPIK